MATFPDVDVKDFTAGTATTIKGHDLGSSKTALAHVLYDAAGAEVVGRVTASPAANTVLGRLKDLLTLVVLAAGANIIGKVGIDQTTPGTTDSVTVKSRNALWAAGASNSGLLTAAFNLQSTELNALANAALIISSVGGSAGKFTNNDTGQAKFGEIFFTLGTVTTMSVGANLAGWFLQSPDSGSTFESLTVVPPRPPDFIVPLDATTGNKPYKASARIYLPALQFKVLVQNNSGQAFTATGNTLKLAPLAETM